MKAHIPYAAYGNGSIKKQMGRTFPLMKGGKLDFIYQYGNVWVKSHVFHPLHGKVHGVGKMEWHMFVLMEFLYEAFFLGECHSDSINLNFP